MPLQQDAGNSYMEVAVNRSKSFVFHCFRLFSLGFVLVTAVGCADMITYSQDAQREGSRYFKQGDYTNAAGAFRNSVRQNPQNYEGYYWLGQSYHKLGQYQQAIASYKTARQTIEVSIPGKRDDEMREKILVGLADSIAKGDPRNIETDIALRDAENRGTAANWFVVARIYENRGDADSAIDAYNRAVLLEPNNFMVAKSYGLFLERVGQNMRAETPLRRAYSLNNQDEQVIAALRRVGVIPGPSLNDQDQLAKPALPKARTPTPNPTLTPEAAAPNNTSSGRPRTTEVPRD